MEHLEEEVVLVRAKAKDSYAIVVSGGSASVLFIRKYSSGQ